MQGKNCYLNFNMMKKIFLLIIPIVFLCFSCKTTQQKNVNTSPEKKDEVVVDPDIKYSEFGMPILLEYKPAFIDLGEVKRGEKRNLEFEYTNISKDEVEIEVVTACSCTETDYTVARMQPGESGKIVLVFDSKSKDKSETIDVDIILKNTDPKTGYPIVDRVGFKFDLLQ